MTKWNYAWQRFIVTVNFGALESVAPPIAASNVPIEDSPGSRGGVTYEVATGEMIDNLGQNNCFVHAGGGPTEQLLAFEIREFHTSLLSV